MSRLQKNVWQGMCIEKKSEYFSKRTQYFVVWTTLSWYRLFISYTGVLFCNSNTSGHSVFLLCTPPVIWICMRHTVRATRLRMKMCCPDKLSKGLIDNGKWPPKICPANKLKCLQATKLWRDHQRLFVCIKKCLYFSLDHFSLRFYINTKVFNLLILLETRTYTY